MTNRYVLCIVSKRESLKVTDLNEFAISSADIGEAMETSAAALKAGGNSLNESLGILTAANIIQQDASTTSSALKILSLRIRGRIMPPYKVIYMRYTLA